MSLRVLTGITTTGIPHLGNYVGAIRPAILASQQPDTESFFFLADYHALIKCDDPDRIERSRLAIAATWLAAGLDTSRVVFYRQSDIPEIPELTWLLTCVTAKGLMNRAHAYKASVDQNELAGNEPDDGVTMGLFSYPILMAADILIFNANKVPVGRDQVQHIEMARDVAQRFNHLFGKGRQFFVLPEAAVDEAVATLPGLDGRKMSKSYDNTVPLFEGGPKGLREAIARIVTDSRLPGEPKDPDSTSLTALFDAFATPAEREAFRADLRAGLGWGEAKQRLVEQLEREIAPMRARYEELIAHPAKIEEALQEGARKARALATPLLAELRQAVGLRPMVAAPSAWRGRGPSGRRERVSFLPRLDLEARMDEIAGRAKLAAKPVFKQYREADGRFYFKLTDPQGRLLLQSEGFDGGRDAGQWVGRLKSEGAAALAGAPVQAAEGVSADEIAAALASFAEE